MSKFWNAALAVGGLGGIGAFIFWSLYKDWLNLSIFSKLSQEHTFYIMLAFLVLTFLSLFLMLMAYIWTEKQKDLKSSDDEQFTPDVHLIDASLSPNNKNYSETCESDKNIIKSNIRE